MDDEEWAWFEPFNHLATEMIQNMHSLCLGLSVPNNKGFYRFEFSNLTNNFTISSHFVRRRG